MIRAFWLVPVGIVTTLLVIVMYIYAASSGSMPGGPEHFILLLIGEGPLIAFFILNINHRKREGKNPNTEVLQKEIELLKQGLKDKDIVINELRTK